VISSSPEKAGRSSKSRVKSPCWPQAVGDAEADAEVLLDVMVVLSDEAVDEPVVEVTELTLDDVGTAGPFAKELPMDVKA
jgi:hypothetical protein